MGAYDFYSEAVGKTAQEAFALAVEDAAYEHGHGGYTGTIAEKSEFVMIKLPTGQDAHRYAEQLVHGNDDRIDDKWGPAGCIDMGPEPLPRGKRKCHRYLFFGWASS